MALTILVHKIKDNARIPAYAHPLDSGLDLYAACDMTIPPLARALVPTGLKMEIPPGYEGQIRPKSGLALKFGITVLNTPGTIDSPYRGEIGIILFNSDPNHAYSVRAGEKIAQMVFCRVEYAEFKETKVLSETKRGEGGFGSSGLK